MDEITEPYGQEQTGKSENPIFDIGNEPVMQTALDVLSVLGDKKQVILKSRGNSIPNAVAVANIITEKMLKGNSKIQKINLSLFYLYHLRYIGFFFNNFLPSAVGGDLMCAYLASRRTGKGLESFAGIFIDRMVGFLTIFLLALGAFVSAQQKFQIPYHSITPQPEPLS